MDQRHFLRLSLSQAILLLDRTTNLKLIRKPTGSKYVVLIGQDLTGQVSNSLPRPIKRSIHHCIALEWHVWFLTWEGMSLLKNNQLLRDRVAQLVAAWQPGCEKMEREWDNEEEIEREWGNGERMRKWREIYSPYFIIFSLFPPSLSISYLNI